MQIHLAMQMITSDANGGDENQKENQDQGGDTLKILLEMTEKDLVVMLMSLRT